MKSKHRLWTVLVMMAGLVAGSTAVSAEAKKDAPAGPSTVIKGKLIAAKEVDAAWLEKARKNYPLNVCISSDEKFGEEITDLVYREPGKPDRLIRVCCEGCGDDFLKEADKCLAKLDAAAKEKARASKKPDDKGRSAPHD